MRFGLKSRLRLISFFPIIIVFSFISFYVYDSFLNLTSSTKLQSELSKNKLLNDLVTNISRERGITVMYLANLSKKTLKSLKRQRLLVDKDYNQYISYTKNDKSIHVHKDGSTLVCNTCEQINYMENAYNLIKKTRVHVDSNNADFKQVYSDVYGKILNTSIENISKISSAQKDQTINELTGVYLQFTKA
jgi:hypothetical protein